MTPDPSRAARAPQTTLDEVREALAEYGRALLYWDDLPGKCTEDEAHAISTHIKKHAPRWLGALVQAVEDQQTEVSRLRADGQRLRQSLDDAAITMRNYYRGAISRAAVDEKIVLIRAALAWWDAQ